jgi:tRNA G10  N-methylase Trm11
MDMLPVVGDGASIRLGEKHLKVDLRNYDLEVVAIVLQQHVHLGLVLTNAKTTFSSNLPPERVPPILFREGVTACLRPSTARLFLAMCQPRAGEVVCDFMAGVGTIPFVAAAMPLPFPQVLALGGDESEEAMGHMRQNFTYLREEMGGCISSTGEGEGRAAVVGLARWDARYLPLREGVVDVGIVDLPFGKRHKHKGGRMVHLYERAFREMARVIRPGGRLLLLASRASFVEESLQGYMCEGCWSQEQQQQQQQQQQELEKGASCFEPKRVNIGGLRGVVYLVVRTTAPLPVLPEWPVKEERKPLRRRAWESRTEEESVREGKVIET